MDTEVKDQIDLFAERGKRKIRYFCILYFVFIFLGVLIMYMLSGGRVEKYKDSYIAMATLLGIFLFLMLILNLASAWRLRKEKQKFTREELKRINREAAKGPKWEHILVTHDVVAYHLGIRVILIPVKDIIWIREWWPTSTDRPASISSVNTGKYISVRTRDGMPYHIPNNIKKFDVWAYFVSMVTDRRPGVIIGRDDKWAKTTKREFRDMVEEVDAEGTTDAAELEMIYHVEQNYALYRSGIGDSRPTEVKLMLFIMGTYLVSIFLFQMSALYMKHSDLIKQELLIRIWKGFGIGAILLLPVIVTIICFVKNIVLNKERITNGIDFLIYALFALITFGPTLGYAAMVQEQIRPVDAVKEWKLYESGKLDTSAYEGKEETSKELTEFADHWEYGEWTYAKHPEVYGYDQLSKEEQADFDLLYSDLLIEGLESVESVRAFDLPYPVDKAMFDRINGLYQCNHKYNHCEQYQYEYYEEDEPYGQYQYESKEEDEPLKTYAVINYQVGDAFYNYNNIYQQTTEKIAAKIPDQLSDEEKVKWIAQYLTKQVEVCKREDWMKNTDHSKEAGTWEYKRGLLTDSGYGALVMNIASEQGFMEAFGMIARKAGIYTIAAMNESAGCYWNLVLIDGSWKAIDVCAMAREPEKRDHYYLVSNTEMEEWLQVQGTYGGNTSIPLPE